MPSLDTIPAELKAAVFEYLSYLDLFSLSQTCKTINKVAIPAMYHSTALVWNIYGIPRSYTSAKNMILLLRTVLEDQDVAHSIKSLSFRAHLYHFMPKKKKEGRHTDGVPIGELLRFSEREVIRQEIEDLYPEQKELVKVWKAAMTEKQSVRHAMLLLVARCAELRHLVVDTTSLFHLPSDRTQGYAPIENIAEATKKGIDGLESFSLVPGPFSICLTVDMILPLFSIASLRAITLDGVDIQSSSSTQGPSYPLSKPLLSLVTLNLTSIWLPLSALHTFLSLSPNLSSLSFTAYLPASEAPLCLPTLSNALRLVEGTLESLTLGCNYDSGEVKEFEILHDVIQGTIGSLRSFAKLKHLAIPIILLHNMSVVPLDGLFPDTLERLTLRDDLCEYYDLEYWSYDAAVRIVGDFMQGRWREETPLLRELRLSDWVPYLDECGDEEVERGAKAFEELLRVCQREGITLTSHNNDRQWWE